MRVTVVYSPAARQTREWALDMPAHATLADALEQCGIYLEFPGLQAAFPGLGVWGVKATLKQRLHAGDRIEIYRPLVVDPKVARRERFRRQGAKGAGLFASRRAGAKAGY